MQILADFVIYCQPCPYLYHMANLKNAKLNKYYYVLEISSSVPTKVARRLFDLGFTEGQKVRLVRKSLLGKALLIELRGYTLSMRGSVAEAVIIND